MRQTAPVTLTRAEIAKAAAMLTACRLCGKPFRGKENRMLGVFQPDTDKNPGMVCLYMLHARCLARMTHAELMEIDTTETRAFTTMVQALPTLGGEQ